MPKRFATVKREGPDRLAIEMHYVLEPGERSDFRGFHCRWLNRPESIHRVPFEEWEKYVGQTIPFAQLTGSGEGMIGGATKTRVGGDEDEDGSISCWLYDGVLGYGRVRIGSPNISTEEFVEEVVKEITDFKEMLQDESYDFSDDYKEKMLRLIKNGQDFLMRREPLVPRKP